jgi:hypothetical protein
MAGVGVAMRGSGSAGGSMILYHYTRAERLASIKRKGLLPQPGDHMTAGMDRVWLTAQPDLSLTEREAQWLAKHGGPQNMVPVIEKDGGLRLEPRRTWLSTGGLVGGGLCGGLRLRFIPDEPLKRLTVRMRKNDRRLHRYATWPHRPRGNDFDLRALPYARLWYIYDDAIPPDRITAVATVAPMH